MPNSITYAKAVSNFNCSIINTNYWLLSFDVYDNYNTGTGNYEARNEYSYFLSSIGTTLLLNSGGGINKQFVINCYNQQIAFNDQEYFDIANGVMLDVGGVYQLVTSTIL